MEKERNERPARRKMHKKVCHFCVDRVEAIDYILTNYERISDHCSNIAVAMIELESDEFDTHQYLKSVKELKSSDFTRLYEEYSRVYSI